MTHPPKTYRVKCFGCQMNVYDGERMGELLAAQGMTAAEGEEAELVVLNTCHIREKAAEKAYSDIGRLAPRGRHAADDRARRLRGAGRGREAHRRVQDDRHRRRPAGLSPPARDGRRGRRGAAARSTPTCRPSPSSTRSPRAAGSARAPSSRCRKAATNSAPIASCPTPAAPKSRGPGATSSPRRMRWSTPGRARSPCSARTSTRGRRRASRGLDALIRALAKIDGLERIRYTTSHPADMTDALIAAHGEVDKLMPYLHLPVQSGSDRILKAMNRSHSRRLLSRACIERVRAARPDIAISGDFIVGFPGETEDDFADTSRWSMRSATLRLIRSNIRPARAPRRRPWRAR